MFFLSNLLSAICVILHDLTLSCAYISVILIWPRFHYVSLCPQKQHSLKDTSNNSSICGNIRWLIYNVSAPGYQPQITPQAGFTLWYELYLSCLIANLLFIRLCSCHVIMQVRQFTCLKCLGCYSVYARSNSTCKTFGETIISLFEGSTRSRFYFLD